MKIFAIGDLHLSFGETVEKPMDIFGGQWIGHTEKLYKSWHEKISDEDIAIICGDISWGLKLEEAKAEAKAEAEEKIKAGEQEIKRLKEELARLKKE